MFLSPRAKLMCRMCRDVVINMHALLFFQYLWESWKGGAKMPSRDIVDVPSQSLDRFQQHCVSLYSQECLCVERVWLDGVICWAVSLMVSSCFFQMFRSDAVLTQQSSSLLCFNTSVTVYKMILYYVALPFFTFTVGVGSGKWKSVNQECFVHSLVWIKLDY